MKEELDNISNGINKVLKTTPELYHDAIQPFAQESGKLIARIPRTINAVFAGLDKWIAEREGALAKAEQLVAIKLKDTDPEKIVEPEPYVAIPAIQAISYSMNSEELRNLYANLLANSMISDTKDSVHPSFIEIIKQMSPTDARVFQLIMSSETRPIIDLRKYISSGDFSIVQYHCSWIQDIPIKQCSTSIDSLLRLGLIDIPLEECYSDQEIYNNVIQNPLFKKLEEQSNLSLSSDEHLAYEHLYIKISDLSILFYNVCVLDP